MTVILVDDRHGQSHRLDGDRPTVMEIMKSADLDVAAICGGCLSCATCHVYVDEQWLARLPPRSADELALLEQLAAFDPLRSRLSCQIALGDVPDGLALALAPED